MKIILAEHIPKEADTENEVAETAEAASTQPFYKKKILGIF